VSDVWMEGLRALVVGWVVITLLRSHRSRQVKGVAGWHFLLAGFLLIFFGSVIDITDNFPSLNHLVVIGDTETEAFLEKMVGYLLGFLLLAVGIWRWLPGMAELQELHRREAEIQKERLRVLRATMRTVLDIVNNGLNHLELVRMEAEERSALSQESLDLLDRVIRETSEELVQLGSLETVSEKAMAVGTGIDYESSAGDRG